MIVTRSDSRNLQRDRSPGRGRCCIGGAGRSLAAATIVTETKAGNITLRRELAAHRRTRGCSDDIAVLLLRRIEYRGGRVESLLLGIRTPAIGIMIGRGHAAVIGRGPAPGQRHDFFGWRKDGTDPGCAAGARAVPQLTTGTQSEAAHGIGSRHPAGVLRSRSHRNVFISRSRIVEVNDGGQRRGAVHPQLTRVVPPPATTQAVSCHAAVVGITRRDFNKQ